MYTRINSRDNVLMRVKSHPRVYNFLPILFGGYYSGNQTLQIIQAHGLATLLLLCRIAFFSIKKPWYSDQQNSRKKMSEK